MTTTITIRPNAPGAAAPPRYTRRSLLRVYRTEAWQEFLKLIRVPIFAATTVALPLMFYVIFGITFAGEQAGGVGMTTYMLATYGAFGVIGVALFGFGVSVAVERGAGLDAPEAGRADAAAGLLRRQGGHEPGRGHNHRAGHVHPRGPRRRRPSRPAAVGRDRAGAGRGCAAVLGDGFGVRLPGGPELRPGGAEPGVAADGVRVGVVDPDLPAARRGAVGRGRSAAVSLHAVGAGRHRSVRGRLAGRACRRSAGIHAVVPGRGSLGVPSRRGTHLRMKRGAR